MGNIISAIAGAINAVISAIASFFMAIFSGIASVLVAIWNFITCGCCSGGTRRTRRGGVGTV
ncbi:hypothetical protein I315_04544 [Cryptococcus gattii Ru294]|uniref:Unplaced genomic scaffold supercont1.15, whole genome shotgun sequence n=4 Tax=Cryptococcus gattii species complex TaxID=1884637 RepID=A0A0D0UWC3_9TREE|nr:hypothetical protein I309_03623 [Cryptococcus deuterogattii LA55]KIR32253.1 hypothetical protein I352_05489 [Cryptococcus deuterogattii MMRL2647]KIR38449.1 hypothetical protein I313_05557 [Cryptococcus deuterogattii Ram5]KIR44571.1 hypothetical protein I312_06201 [Cryptococcus bacillisporus CA1280]KIR53082.1 hypothetical protein I315_04544 [Cryptococcus gattii Ru294]KIR58517.1 hypothetical protein I314_05765 [Cryptococcus bacillisporus CA1873]KIR70436.1 hypothetical protein I310_05682 [Cry|eukprot:KIR58517.1 hypothetical protein I314_05765 [Cryptococcus gattii CA1873]